jgi:hypothetical protein
MAQDRTATEAYFEALALLHIDLGRVFEKSKDLIELATKAGDQAMGAYTYGEFFKLLNHVGGCALRIWEEIQAAKKEGA